MNSTFKQYLQYACKAVVGVVFCVSAILKLVSIESFEIYVFSFQFFGLPLSYIAARIIICLELIIGAALLLNIYKRQVYIAALSLLTAFTFFLLYVHFFRGNDENCHCFGELLQLNPLYSIVKNAALVALVLVSRNAAPFGFAREKITGIVLSAVVFASIFIISPPDNWLTFDTAEYNETALNEAFANNVLDENDFRNGNTIVCFYGAGCRYCDLANKKMEVILQNYPGIVPDIVGVFWGTNENYTTFIENSKVPFSKTILISPAPFLKITNGIMPVLLVIKDGKVVNTLKYRSIDENVFLQVYGSGEMRVVE